MTTPTSASTNKTALRASLKKEDESLAERLVATDIPLVATPEPEAPVVAPVAAPASPPPLAAAPARKAAAKPAANKPATTKPATAKPVTAKPVTAKPAVAKPAADVVPTPPAKAPAKAAKKVAAVTAATTKAAEPVTAAKAKPVSRKAAAAAKPVAAKPAKPSKPVKVATKDSAAAAPATATEDAGKKAAKLAATVANIEKAAKEKGDRIVRYTVELLKSEEAAIEAVRAELAKGAGWAASKSDILRAGVRVFAEQRVEQMKELLGALATLSKGKKKG